MKYTLTLLLALICFVSQAQTVIFPDYPDSINIIVSKFWNGVIVPTSAKQSFKLTKGHGYTTIIIKHPTQDKDYNFEYNVADGVIIPPKPPMIMTMDNAHPSLVYVGWIQAANQPWTVNYYLKTAAYSGTKDNTVRFAFSGTGFELWFEKRSNHGEFAVSIDSGPEVNVDTYSTTTASPVTPEKVFEKLGLVDGDHQVKIRVTGVKNPAAATAPISAQDKADVSVSIDKIVFFKPSL